MLLEVDGAPLNERVLGNHKLGETIFTRYREHLAKTEEKNTRNNNLSEHSLACSKKIDNALISLPSAVPTSAFVAPFVKWSNYTSSVSAKQNRKGFQTSLNAENTTLLKVTKSEIFRLPKKLHGQPTTNEKNNRRKQLNSSAKNGLRKNGQNFYVNNQSRDFNIKSSTKSKYGGKHSHSSCGFYKKQSYFLPSAPYASKQYSRDIKKREDLVHTSPDKTDFFVCPRKSRLKSLLKEDANVTLPPSIINSISPLDVLKTEPTVANIKRKAFTSHSSREGNNNILSFCLASLEYLRFMQ